MNLYKYPFLTFLDILQNIWKLKPVHFTQLKELAQKNEQEDPEDSAHLLNEEAPGSIVPLCPSINPHISRSAFAFYFFALHLRYVRPAMRNKK